MYGKTRLSTQYIYIYIYHGFNLQLHTQYVFKAYFTKQFPILERRRCAIVATYTVRISAFADTSVAHAAPGGFAGEIKYTKFVINKNAIVCCRFVEPAQVGSVDCYATATAKVEIRRGPFTVSPQVNGVCSCSEGDRR